MAPKAPVYVPEIGMAIPRRISFLEESRSRGMTNLHSSGIEEYEIYSSGSSRNFEELYALKFAEKLPVYYKKNYILHKFLKISKIPSEISNFITYFDCPRYVRMRKSDKSPRK